MAACIAKFLRPWSPGVLPARWTRYNPYYLEPEPSKEVYRIPVTELTDEQKAAQELKAVRPIKAAPPGLTSSVFSDPTVSKFVNMMMEDGDKVLARSIITQTFESMKRKQVEKYHKAPATEKEGIECNPYTIFHQALENCKPIIGLISIQKGGKYYQVPTPLTDSRRRFLAMKWLITECQDNKHRRTHMYEKLSQELLAAFMNEGNVIKRKHDMHKMAEANRAFAHYRWW
ncbi:28S ribosomal protein S7, mitochondrial-like [Acipenser oxyrinchus oxyrinchus]|uniref:Small ribosomal subunit protein uS7m n=1 Tax=Acipenser oxyrinchus oxyrinchus TaxID=40147 RepID=A0AAD8D261_ACIOX|nr:28S ribosomal protein S7, mitochondrial-like [Acipenser oxyrinchus oxyrinchus]